MYELDIIAHANCIVANRWKAGSFWIHILFKSSVLIIKDIIVVVVVECCLRRRRPRRIMAPIAFKQFPFCDGQNWELLYCYTDNRETISWSNSSLALFIWFCPTYQASHLRCCTGRPLRMSHRKWRGKLNNSWVDVRKPRLEYAFLEWQLCALPLS